jgi:hypothetical protein
VDSQPDGGSTNCRLVQASARVFPTTTVTSGPTASVITGASLPNLRPASAEAYIKLPSGLSSAAFSIGREASLSTPVPVTLQQAGQSSAVSAAHGQAASAVVDVKPPSGLSVATSSAGKAASPTPPAPAAHQQAGSSSAARRTDSGLPFTRSAPVWLASYPCSSNSSSSGSGMW